jgi:hypothetical protein
MSNALITPTAVLRKSLAILHQKANFLSTINRSYDDQFAKSGGKIGATLNVRQPNQFVIRNGANLSLQDTTESVTPVTISAQKGVDMYFTSADLTLSLDDFAERIIEPAMAVLVSNVEADALSMYQNVWNQVNNQGAAISFNKILQARKFLNDNLCPQDNNRSVLLCTQDNVDLVDQLKGLFQDSASIAKQYSDGMMGKSAGFDFYENTLLPPKFTSGTDNSNYLVTGAGQTGTGNPATTGMNLNVKTGAGTFTAGDIITIAGVYMVHPETKISTGNLQNFVVTANYAGGAGALAISPGIVTSGAYQNVSASPADSAAITKVGAAGQQYGMSLAYHRDAFCFATCDLVMPKGVDFAAQENFDGISLRIVRAYDINTDRFPCRLDIMYGYKTLRPQLAARLANN